MQAIDRKALRDLWHMRGQALAIALVIAAGIAMLVMSATTLDSLRSTRTQLYQQYRFSHIWSQVRRAPEGVAARVAELLAGVPVDESRLLTECAVYADKTDINEELARLGSHFAQFREILNEKQPAGRKLDFLVQELNREVNTIGSKACDTEIARYVIDAKCAIERIREQIQNIE